MAKYQSFLSRIGSNRDRAALRGIFSQFLTDDDPPALKDLVLASIVLSGAETTEITISGASTTGILQSGTSTTAYSITGAFTTGIAIAADGTTGISITSAFSGVNAISLAGTGSTAGINISGNHTTAITIGAQTTAGLAITGATATGISVTGACSTAALQLGVSGTPAGDFIWYGTTALYKVLFDADGDTNGAVYFGADTKGLLVSLFGDTTGCGVFWDPSTDTNGTLSIGASGGSKGNDLAAYGATNGNYMHWDQSANSLLLVGTSTVLNIAGTTAATTSATGALICAGGVGIGGATFFGSTTAVGAFSSATAGSGIALSAATTAATRVYADDGGAKLAAGEKRVTITRFLYATEDTDGTDQTMSANVGQIKVANNLTIGGNLAGVCGYLEVAAAKTLIGGTFATGAVATAVWGRVDLPSTAVAGTAAYISAFAASANLGGTHTGKASVLHIPNPAAGVWDALISLGSTTGCTVANALVPAAAPDVGTMGADLALIIDVNGTPYYIPMYDTLHA
jgi:hypothetical protein